MRSFRRPGNDTVSEAAGFSASGAQWLGVSSFMTRRFLLFKRINFSFFLLMRRRKPHVPG
jgi:hypothetical protein